MSTKSKKDAFAESDSATDNDKEIFDTVERQNIDAEVETGTEIFDDTSDEAGINPEEEIDNLEELKKEIAQLKDARLRSIAEMENIKKRVQRERIQLFEDARVEAVKAFLEINDDLQRSLDAGKENTGDFSFFEGVEMVAQKFQKTLHKMGVEAIAEAGVPFDVDLHDALLRQPSQDSEIPSNHILQIIENGYRIGSKTIKHAKVIVSE